ncbi:hypothetical protein Vadar_008623 [Vaccinium darrowii]|uniref:Uncharacterized protein n=1 Tax=Vaccinium darrowii TaxID=229202 RepID=A0ACB7Z2U2_9ERIC|nr:hypothetical protein Vadar_008623 [Vaccinium darrowii]
MRRLSRLIERMWLQKSRVRWHLKGDRNTRYFHLMAKSRQSRNSIPSVTINDPILLEDEVFKYFQNLYSEDWEIRPFFCENRGHVIDGEISSILISKFTEEEVWNAIRSCDDTVWLLTWLLHLLPSKGHLNYIFSISSSSSAWRIFWVPSLASSSAAFQRSNIGSTFFMVFEVLYGSTSFSVTAIKPRCHHQLHYLHHHLQWQ